MILNMASESVLPEFLDRRACRELLGMTRVDVDRLFQRCTVYAIDASRKVYISSGEAMGAIHAYPPGSIRRTWETRAP